MKPTHFPAALLCALTLVSLATAGTRVDMETSIGTIKLELYDDEKPLTTSNFLNYINTGAYENSFVHRLIPGFVLQGGGFTVQTNQIINIPTNTPIANEAPTGTPFSNRYGTISMARVSGNADSATSQWFINLADNTNLDTAEGGYAVFGYVIEGIDILERFNTTFTDLDQNTNLIVYGNPPLDDLPVTSNSGNFDSLVSTKLTVAPEPNSLFLITIGISVFGILSRHRRA